MKDKIFNYIYPNDNDNFSNLNGKEIQNLIILLKDYLIYYRDKLDFNNNVTFGTEIEFEKANRDEIIQRLKDGWDLKTDISLEQGAEVVSPILYDVKGDWDDLWNICKLIQNYGSIQKKAASHVHVGAHILGTNKDNWLNFIKLWSTYENIIYRFCYGEYYTHRPSIVNYAEPMKNDYYNDYIILKQNNSNLSEIINKISHGRNVAINFNNVSKRYIDEIKIKNTIEFRIPNGTLNPIIWQNNINLFVKLLNYANSINFNDNIIDKRQSIIKKYNSIKWYNEIFLNEAIELADLIFNTNLDKINFLKQYLKNYEISSDYSKTRKITK